MCRFEDFADDIGYSALSVSPLFESIDPPPYQHKTTIFDKFVVNSLSSDVFTLEF